MISVLQLLLFVMGLFLMQLCQMVSSDSAGDSYNQKLWTAQQIPEQLMNPVVRSQLRQRLLKLKQKDALLRKQSAFTGFSSDSSVSSPFHNRNCFFSPINCHLPVLGQGQRSMKRRVLGHRSDLLRTLGQQQQQQQQEEQQEQTKLVKYIQMALTNSAQSLDSGQQ